MTRTVALLLVAMAVANAWLGPNHLVLPKAKDTCPAGIVSLARAYASYFDNLGLKLGTTYDEYQKTLTNLIFGVGINGQIAVCNWIRQLESDLTGIDTADTCMNIDSLKQALSVSALDADNFVTDYFRQQFECGEGYDVLIKNFNCIKAVYTLHRDALESCVDQLNAATNGTTDSAICLAYNDYISCEGAIFTKFCSAQVSQWVCRVDEITVKVNTDHCDSVLQKC